MYVALSGPKGKESVTVREDYFPAGSKKKKIRIVKNYGPLKKLEAEDPDFLRKLKEQVKQQSIMEREGRRINVTLSMEDIRNESDSYQRIVIGHVLIRRLWEMMRLGKFFEGFFMEKRNLNRYMASIFYLLSRRMSEPSSIKRSFEDADRYAGVSDISLDVLYTVLDGFCSAKDDLIEYLGSFFEKNTKRDLSHVCYDVTNYYFESTKAGELRLFGYSKEHRSDCVIVVMGLLIDSNGIPITFQIFNGATMDQNTLADAVVDLRKKYGLGEITVVADRGMNSNSNLIFLSEEGHHFVISYTLKKSKKQFREMCITDKPEWEKEVYDEQTGELVYAAKVLNTTCEAKVKLTDEESKAIAEERKKNKTRGRCPIYKSVEIPAKVHVTYSKKRADKDAADRARALEKLQKRIDNGQVKASLHYGCNQYLQFEADTENAKIDAAKIIEAARYDGYYAVITDRDDLTTDQVMEIYKDQWKIEESFRILKTDLEARPVFVWDTNRIIGHFTLCYLALSMIRYTQYCIQEKGAEQMSAARIMNAINDSEAVIIGEDGNYVLGACVTADYILLSQVLGGPCLQKTMRPVHFKALTGLDPRPNIKKLVG